MTQIALVFQQAVNQLQSKRFLEADQLCNQILALHPNQPDALHLMALSAKQQGNPTRARQLFEKSIKANNSQPAVYFNFANLLVSQEEFTLAEENYRQSLALQPDNGETLYSLASVLEQQQKYTQSLELLELLAKDNRVNVNAYNLKGNCLRKLKRFDEALEQYDNALSQEANNFFALHNKGVTFRELQQPEAALECYRPISELGSNVPEFLFNVACAYFDLKDFDNAETHLKAAIELRPDYVEAHKVLNNLYWENSRDDLFLNSFRASLKRAPRSESLWYSLAANLIMAKRENEAKEVLNEAIEAVGKQAAFTHALGVLYSKEQDFERAATYIASAVKMSPENSRYQIDMANILIQQCDYLAALKHLDIAQHFHPLNQEIWAYKGICWRLLEDRRHQWLNNYDLLVNVQKLDVPPGYDNLEHFIAEYRKELLKMHSASRQPLDQSVSGGTQTVGNLLLNQNNVIQDYRLVLQKLIQNYLDRLPDDPEHPFLNRNTRQYSIAGSWSILLNSGGFHSNHVHPDGWLSGPTYISVPDNLSLDDPLKSGWVKLGETSLKLGEREEIGKEICPETGLCVLFPSYIWHGTYPFESTQQRITSPCDISPVKG
jgi:uncharacterized protein (TIGR02466 family)